MVENQININIIEFVKKVNNFKYKIDISFINEFIELVSKDECCIHHNMLQKYGILSLNCTTNNIKRVLEQNNFIVDEDFRLLNVEQSKSGGCTHKNEYYLHPDAFKICLMRSKNTKKYAKYYILLEKCIKYFNDYQLELNKKYNIKLKLKIEKKDIKIDKLEEKINKILEDNKIMLENNKKILDDNKNLEVLLINSNNKLSKLENKKCELFDSVEDLKDDKEEINHKLDITIKKLDISTEERVINPNNNQQLHRYQQHRLLVSWKIL